MEQEQIEFNKTRDFSETLTISFSFLKQNFNLFFQTLLFLVGPILLLNAILSGIYLQNQFDITSIIKGNRTASDVFSPVYFLVVIFSLIANIMLMGIVYEFIMLYEKKGFGNFDVKEVWNAFVSDIGLIISTFLFLIGIAILFIVVFGLIAYLLVSLGAGGMIVVSMVFLLVFFVLGPPLAFLISAIYPIRIRERVGNGVALLKAYELVKANFGNTWIIMFVSYVIVAILAIVLTLPTSIAAGVMAFNSASSDTSSISSLVLTVFNVIATFGGSLVNTILLIIVAFHYFSLNEKEYGDGLLDRINQIGEQTDSNEDITI